MLPGGGRSEMIAGRNGQPNDLACSPRFVRKGGRARKPVRELSENDFRPLCAVLAPFLKQAFEDAAVCTDQLSPYYGTVLGFIEWGFTATYVEHSFHSAESVTYWISGPSGGVTYQYTTLNPQQLNTAADSLTWGSPVPQPGYAPDPTFLAFYNNLGWNLK